MNNNLFADMSVIQKELYTWLAHVRQQATANNHRVALVLSGKTDWCYSMAQQIIQQEKFESVLTVSANIPMGLAAKKARTQLGREHDAIVFDACQALDIDAFGAVAGTLCGGGFLLLLVPEQNSWPELKASRFLQRALPFIKKHDNVYFVDQHKGLPKISISDTENVNHIEVESPFRTLDQKQLVNEIRASVIKHSKADRKSTRLNSSHRCFSYAVFCLKKTNRS